VLPSSYSVGLNALYAFMTWVNHGLVAVELIELLSPVLFLSMGTLLLLSGMVLFLFSIAPC
jgi:hypothetical protein